VKWCRHANVFHVWEKFQPLHITGWTALLYICIIKRGLRGRDCMVIYNYLCNQCLSPLKLRIRIPFIGMCTRYNIMWSNLPVICADRWFSLGIPVSSTVKLTTTIPLTFVESGFKHHSTNPNPELLSYL
jgi:hypothetical protein